MVNNASPSANAWRKARNRRRSMLNRLYAKHEGVCAHCGVQTVRATSHRLEPISATVDHVMPRCKLPIEEWFNDDHAVLSCFRCNQANEREMTRRKKEEERGRA